MKNRTRHMKGISSRLISKGGVLNGLIRYQEYTEWPKQILSLEKSIIYISVEFRASARTTDSQDYSYLSLLRNTTDKGAPYKSQIAYLRFTKMPFVKGKCLHR